LTFPPFSSNKPRLSIVLLRKFRMSAPAANLARIHNLRAAIETIRLSTFDLERQLQPFEDWRREALEAIIEIEGSSDSQWPEESTESTTVYSSEYSSGEFNETTADSSCDEPYDPPAKSPRRGRPALARPVFPPPMTIFPPQTPAAPQNPVTPTAPAVPAAAAPISTGLAGIPAFAGLPSAVQYQLLLRVFPQFTPQIMRFYREAAVEGGVRPNNRATPG
jgi:hypothetical protein